MQREPGLDDHRIGDEIDLTNGVHPHQRQNDGRAIGKGRLATDQPGISTLWHDGRARLVADSEDSGDLVARLGPDHAAGTAVIEIARLDEIGCDVVVVRQDIRVADDCAKAPDDIVGYERCRMSGHERSPPFIWRREVPSEARYPSNRRFFFAGFRVNVATISRCAE